jgi:two-component system, cell cycle sensor histidine kinase and response regulator CckA
MVNKEDIPATQIRKGEKTVLLVDDEEMILDVGTRMIKSFGYKVLTAGGGKEALELYMSNKELIDIVILDMIMPGMNGGETFDMLRQLDSNIKVLLSSGYSIDGRAQEILDRGCDGFIQKPFDMKGLSNKIVDILAKR